MRFQSQLRALVALTLCVGATGSSSNSWSTSSPTAAPSGAPTWNPTAAPSTAPTGSPTAAPSTSPTIKKSTRNSNSGSWIEWTHAPTRAPSSPGTAQPTANTTAAPSESPTAHPSKAVPGCNGAQPAGASSCQECAYAFVPSLKICTGCTKEGASLTAETTAKLDPPAEWCPAAAVTPTAAPTEAVGSKVQSVAATSTVEMTAEQTASLIAQVPAGSKVMVVKSATTTVVLPGNKDSCSLYAQYLSRKGFAEAAGVTVEQVGSSCALSGSERRRLRRASTVAMALTITSDMPLAVVLSKTSFLADFATGYNKAVINGPPTGMVVDAATLKALTAMGAGKLTKSAPMFKVELRFVTAPGAAALEISTATLTTMLKAAGVDTSKITIGEVVAVTTGALTMSPTATATTKATAAPAAESSSGGVVIIVIIAAVVVVAAVTGAVVMMNNKKGRVTVYSADQSSDKNQENV